MKDYTVAEVEALMKDKIKGSVEDFVQKIVALRKRELAKAEGIHSEPGEHEAPEVGVQPHTEPGVHEQFAISPVQHHAPNATTSAQEPVERDQSPANPVTDPCPLCHKEDVPGQCECLNDPGSMVKSENLQEEKNPKVKREHQRLRTKGEYGVAHKVKEKSPEKKFKKEHLHKEMNIGEVIAGQGQPVIPSGPTDGISSQLASAEKGMIKPAPKPENTDWNSAPEPHGTRAAAPHTTNHNPGKSKPVEKATDEDGFPVGTEVSGEERKKVREAALCGGSGAPECDRPSGHPGSHSIKEGGKFKKSGGTSPVGGGSQDSNVHSKVADYGSGSGTPVGASGELMANSEKDGLCKTCKKSEKLCKCMGKKAEPLSKPSVSEKQHNAMGAAAGGNSTLGIPKSVGKDFVHADKKEGKKFGKSDGIGNWSRAIPSMSFDFSELKKADYNHQSPDSDANQVEHQVDEGEKTDGRGPLDKKPEIMPSNAGTDAGLEPAAVEESSSPIGDVHATPDRSDEEKPKMENDVDEKTPGIDWKKSEGGSMYGMVGENRYRLAKSGNGYTVYHNGNRICDMQKSEDAMAKAEEHFARRAVVENAFYKSASLNKVYLSPSVGRTKPKAAAAPIVGKPAQTGVSAPVAKVATPMDNTSPGKDVAKKAEPSPLDGVKPNAPAVKDGKNVSINKSGSIPMSPQANASASQSAVASAPNTGAAAGAAKMPSIPNHAAPKMPTMKADTELGGVHFKGGKTAGVVGTPRLPGQKPPAEVTGVPNKTGTESGRVGMTNTKGPMAGKRDGGGGVVLNGKDSGRAGMPNTLGKGIDPLAGNKQLNGAVTHSGIVGEPVRPGGAIDKTLGGQKFSGTGNSQSNVGNKATPKVASPYGTPQEQTFQNQGGGKQMPNAPSTGLPASASIGKSGSPWSKEEAREKKDAFKPNPVVKAGTALDNPKVGAPKPVNMGHYANKPQDQGGAERIRFDAQTSPGQKSMPSNGMVTGPNPKGFTVPGVGFTEPTNAPSNPAKKSDVGLDGKGQKKRQLKDASMKASNTFGKALPGQKPAGLPAVAPKVAPLPHAGNTTGAAKIGAVSKQPIQPMSAKPGMSLKAPAKPVAPAGTPKPFGKSELGNCALCSKAEHAGTCN